MENLLFHSRMTADEKESYQACDGSFKRHDKLYRKLAKKYGIVFVEYPERKDYGI